MTKKILNESAETTLNRLYSIMREYDVVEIIKMITDPYTAWPAFKVGLIDKNGKILRLPKTPQEKIFLQPLVILLLDLKKNLLPVFKNTNYSSYIQAINRINLKSQRVMESLQTTDIATPLEPLTDKTSSFRVTPKLFKRLKDKNEKGEVVDINSFPLSIQESIKRNT